MQRKKKPSDYYYRCHVSRAERADRNEAPLVVRVAVELPAVLLVDLDVGQPHAAVGAVEVLVVPGAPAGLHHPPRRDGLAALQTREAVVVAGGGGGGHARLLVLVVVIRGRPGRGGRRGVVVRHGGGGHLRR